MRFVIFKKDNIWIFKFDVSRSRFMDYSYKFYVWRNNWYVWIFNKIKKILVGFIYIVYGYYVI